MEPYAKTGEPRVGDRRPRVPHLTPSAALTRTQRERQADKAEVAAVKRAIKKSARRQLRQQMEEELDLH